MGRARLYFTLHTGVRHFKDSVGPLIQDAITPMLYWPSREHVDPPMNLCTF